MATSDHELYQLFQAEPRLLNAFVPIDPNRRYTFESVTFKSVQRQCDGILRSSDPNEGTFIFEFQMQKKANIYERIMYEVSMFLNENSGKPVCGIIIFKDPSMDPGDLNWGPVAETCPTLLRVLYLNQICEDLKHNQPNAALPAILGPFIENNLDQIRQSAPGWYNQISQMPLDPDQRETITSVFLSLLLNALPGTTEKELNKMGFLVPDLSHTQLYKDLEARLGPIYREEGRQEGRQEGRLEGQLEGEIKVLREFLSKGLISQEDFDRRVLALKQ